MGSSARFTTVNNIKISEAFWFWSLGSGDCGLFNEDDLIIFDWHVLETP